MSPDFLSAAFQKTIACRIINRHLLVTTENRAATHLYNLQDHLNSDVNHPPVSVSIFQTNVLFISSYRLGTFKSFAYSSAY